MRTESMYKSPFTTMVAPYTTMPLDTPNTILLARAVRPRNDMELPVSMVIKVEGNATSAYISKLVPALRLCAVRVVLRTDTCPPSVTEVAEWATTAHATQLAPQ